MKALAGVLCLPVLLVSAQAEPVRFEVTHRTVRQWSAPPEAVLWHVRQPGSLQELLPGLRRIEPLSEGVWLWETETRVPFSAPQRNHFRVRLLTEGDSLAIWRSVSEEDPDWMECRARLRRTGPAQVRLELEFRMRLERPSLAAVHWLAPVLGKRFLQERIQERLVEMVETFLERLEKRLRT